MPWEGLRVAFNGSEGGIQVAVVENSYVNAGGSMSEEGSVRETSIAVFPMFGEPYEITIITISGFTHMVDMVYTPSLQQY